MPKALAIINPKSGTGSKDNIPALLAKAFSETGIELYITYTKCADHAYELAKQAVVDGYERVIAVGGDGTVNEVARGLVGSNTSLGIIPKGSGNGLARALGLPMSSKKAVEIVVKGSLDRIDSCSANDRLFFCTCGMGFDADVSAAFSEAPFRGLLSYAKTAVERYISYKPSYYMVELQDGRRIDSEAFVVAAANASQYGNNAHIAPNADMKDGLVDIVILRPFRVYELPQVTLQLFSKSLEDNTHQASYQTSSATIIRQQSGVVHLDGEPIEMGARIEIKVNPSSISVIRPSLDI